MALNEKYSYKSWKRKSFAGKDPEEFNDSDIIGAGFSQEQPFTDVFPDTIKGVVFQDCNLDNCNIPAGATVKGGTNKHFKIAKDGEFWLVDEGGHPLSPLKPWRFDEVGLSKDPSALSTVEDNATRLGMPITQWKTYLQSQALKDLQMDTAKLIQILKDEGKI
jgi:hypothetical protein